MAFLKVNDNGSIGVNNQKKKKKKQADLVIGSDGKLSFNSEKFRSLIAEKEEEEDIAPVRTDTKRSWFNSGLFDDGYDFGDVTKTILGTNKDLADDLASGVAGIGEGLIDTGAYIAGGAAKLIGADDFSEKMKKFQERDLVKEYNVADKLVDKLSPGGNLLGLANDFLNKDDTEKVSVLGDKSDSLVQSAGQLAGTAGLQMVGVPWWLTTGVTSFGSGTEQAFQNDATYGEAGAYGLISAGAEVLTEKLSGGIKFGGKTLDEGLKKKLTEGITNKTVNTLAKLGFDMVGEGAEEVLTEVVTNIGEKLTFADEKTWGELLTSEEAVEGYIESFIGGAALGGGFSAGKAYKSAKTGRDYDTGLTKNEQSVVNAEVTNRSTEIQKQRAVKEQIDRIIEERERTFGNLSDAEKKSITQQVQTRLESGELDFTKTQLSKKEIAKIESEVMEDLRNGYIGIDTIENTLSGEKTARLRELEQSLTNTTNEAKKAEIEAEINQIRGDRANELKSLLSKDVILQESYRQEALKSEEFTYEVAETDSDITKELLESAKASKMNNTRKMHNLFEYTNKIANDTNTKYGFTNNEQLKELGHDVEGKTVNGLVRVNEDGSTKVLINVDSDKALNTIIGHETTHLLEGTKEYKALQDIVKEYAATKGDYDGRFKQISKLYEGTNANVENEVTADLVGDYLFTDEQFINNLSVKQPNVFQKVYDYIKHAFKMATAGSKEARQLEQVKRRFDKAYKQMSKTTTGKADSNLTTEADSNTKPTSDPDIRFSLSAPVEETKKMVAWHNMSVEGLQAAISIGGLAMPSFAVKPEGNPHLSYGEVSVIAKRDDVEPSKNVRIFGGDAWTPDVGDLNIHYKINDKAINRMNRNVRELIGDVDLGNLGLDETNAEDQLNRWRGNVYNAYGSNVGLRYAYLKDKGVDVSLPTRETSLSHKIDNEGIKYIVEHVSSVYGADEFGRAYREGITYFKEHRDVEVEAIREVVNNYYSEKYGSIFEEKEFYTKEKFGFSDWDSIIRGVQKYRTDGVKTAIDTYAAKDVINEKVDEAGFKKWLSEQFDGVIEKTGIRNEKELFTPSGNRRSFESLHWEYNLANIVKALKGKDQQGKTNFLSGIGSAKGAALKDFKSIEDVRNSLNRIVPESKIEETKEAYDAFNERVGEIASIVNPNDMLDGASDIAEILAKNKTKSGILRYLAKEFDPYYHYDNIDLLASDLYDLIDLANKLPMEYFEAKLYRAYGFDEPVGIVVPDSIDEELFNELKQLNNNVLKYEAGNDADRVEKVNSLSDAKFSLSAPGEAVAPVGNYNVYGRDVKLQEDIAPVKETISKTETVADIAPVKTLEPKEDDELSRPLTEEDLPYVEQDRADAFDNLPVYEPEEIEYYNEPDTAPLDDKFLRLVGKNMRQELGLKNNQVAGLRKIIQDFSTSEDQSMESLHDAIEREFGTIFEKQKLDDITGIKAALRATRIKVLDLIKTDIPDYSKWRQKQFGTLRIANDGMDVDVVYEELKEIYPQYFPEDITNPTDQLLKIAEIASMDATYIEEYSLPEEDIQGVAEYIYESVSEYKQQKRFEAAQTASKAPIDESMIPYKETILETPIPEDALPVKKEEEPEEEPETVVEKTKKELRKHLIEDDAGFLVKALDKAKNIPMALMNNTDTIRVTEMVFGRRAGRKINELVFQKAIDNEARSIAWQNKQRAEIAALGIKARSKESEAVQKYAEKKILTDEGDYITYDDAALERDFPDPDDRAKIIGAARALREKYDTYIDIANNVLTNLGFDPIPKRDDYMRHFQELNDVFTRYGIPFNAQNMQEHVLPTDINGLTEFWSPQKNFFANIKPREGMRTTFDAITGIDGYISGISNLIFHTEDIQRGRALEDLVRETYGETSGWENLEKLPEEEQAARAELIQDNHLSNYAAWLHEWTNNIAGKKNKIDRSIESMFGRRAFSFLDETRKQVGSNMIGLNLSSSLTNLIAPVQAMAKTNKLAVAKGTADTIKNIFVKDNFMENNSFLTSRMGTEMLSKTAWEKMRDAGFVFMKGMDWFSSNQIVRSKFYELKAQGKTDTEAHAEAGKFAARIMGDRTKGANAQLYNSKLVGLVTQFQLEVNNQLYSMFYDTYHESKENAQNDALKTAAGMTFTLGQLFAFTHLFGKTFESIAGYNPTFDVIGILATALGAGDDEEDKPVSERLKDAADKLVDALPYVNVLTGGGRIPITSGIPNLVGVATGGKDDYGNELTWEDELKKLLYLVPPTGGGQIKKTTQGLAMFDSDNPVTGSYTDSGNLRFPVEDTPLNRLQAGVFGQWASGNARDYFDNERKPLGSKQIQEYKDLDIPIADYWKYREDLKGQKTVEDKFNYIADLDLPISKKNIMINNIVDRKEAVDMSNYDQFGSYEEFDWATKNPEKYSFLESIGVSYKQYNASEETKEAYNWAYKNPEKYSLAKAAAGDVVKYRSYVSDLNDLTADKYSNGKTISGSRKVKVANYINSLDADYGSKLVLFKSEYPADDTYNYEIIEYLNNRQDISYDEMRAILIELDFNVDANGNVTW